MRRSAPLAGVLAAAALAGLALALGGWLLALGGAPGGEACGGGELDEWAVPSELMAVFREAASSYGLGSDGPAILAGLTSVESAFGRNMGPSSAGAIGWTQFLPATWRRFGVDADGDGVRDPRNAADAINSAANYLRSLGAPADWRRALFGYNHSAEYVDDVLRRARQFSAPSDNASIVSGAECGGAASELVGGVHRMIGGGRIVPIPGAPGESIDERIVADVTWLIRRFHVSVIAGYAATGHAADGEHPLGLAVDLVPGPDGTWDEVDALARWAEPSQNRPRTPFRWVGYDGDAGHGRGNHLHLSWQHGPAPSRRPPAPWVSVLIPPTNADERLEGAAG